MTNGRKRMGKAILWTVAATLAAVLLILLIVPFTGAVNVAATHSHLPGVHWFLETTQHRSVASQASDIQPPADLASPERIQRGLRSYHQMCAGCHGAPGVEPDWMGQGLNPDPPPLWEPEEREISDAQAARDYWVIEHGIRMTGMPALEPTHSDEEIWDLVAFIQHLPNMSREAYGSAVRDAGLSTETGHEHGTPEGASPSDEGSGDSTHDDHDDHEHGAEAES